MPRAAASPSQSPLLQGTLDMLVLKALRIGPMHGWGIAQRIEAGFEGNWERVSAAVNQVLRLAEE